MDKIKISDTIPDKSTCHDTAVATTPPKSVQEILLKFFPHMKSHDKLIGLINEQVELAEHDPKGRRFDKELINLSLTLCNHNNILNPKFLLAVFNILILLVSF